MELMAQGEQLVVEMSSATRRDPSHADQAAAVAKASPDAWNQQTMGVEAIHAPAKGGRGGRGRGGRGRGTGMVVQPASSVDATAVAPQQPAASPESSETSCVVCCDQERTHALIPCGHLCLCSACTEMLLASAARATSRGQTGTLRCPVCRTSCETAMRVFT